MRVLQLIDSLHSGGAERVAVNLGNTLVEKIDKSFLCATREEGVLRSSIDSNVGYLFLEKRSVFDLKAIISLNKFIRKEKIDILHAHSTSFFIATIIKLLNREVKVIWHDHYGNSDFLKYRKSLAIKLCSKQFDFIFSVNKKLENWAKKYLKNENVLYLPNFAVMKHVSPETKLFGHIGKRIVCLANLREQKDHFTLIGAFKDVLKNHPDWTLHIVGKDFQDNYSNQLKKELQSKKLKQNVFLYGSRPDIKNILGQCDIGVLSSKSEGLPLAILEYGLSELPVVATKVGECKSIIKNNNFGILVNPNNINEFSYALTYLIENKDDRLKKAKILNTKIKEEFTEDVILKTVLNIYKKTFK
ncbi:MAG: glycosyltransferase [Bacteroidia bacterium]|nr:glycosyltransferase [Bacteroidia bacterium]